MVQLAPRTTRKTKGERCARAFITPWRGLPISGVVDMRLLCCRHTQLRALAAGDV
jgi:hypothetical protein